MAVNNNKNQKPDATYITAKQHQQKSKSLKSCKSLKSTCELLKFVLTLTRTSKVKKSSFNVISSVGLFERDKKGNQASPFQSKIHS